jgi:anti-anti-sigma regulatory factor
MSGKLYLSALNENVKEILDIVGFDAIFNLVDSKEEGIKNL